MIGFCKPGFPADGAQALLSRMAHSLEAEARFERALHGEAEIGIGRVGLHETGSGPAVAWNHERTIALVLEGELYGIDAEVQAASAGVRPLSAAAVVLELYEQFGDTCLDKLNGAFVVAIWDRRVRRLVVFNDRFGLFPLYYATVGGGLLFASGVRALLADARLDRTVDLVALREFLLYDHALGDRTFLTSVRLLPQASILSVREGAVEIRQYWTLQYPDIYEPQPERAYVEGLAHYLRQAVARQRPGDLSGAVLLSGGLDSRLLLGLLAEGGDPVQAITFGIPGCDDALFASEAAAAVRAPYHFFDLPPDWLQRWAFDAVRMTDGMGNVVNLHALATAGDAAEHARILYKGFMGDALLGYALKRQMWADYSDDAAIEVHRSVHREQGVLNYEADDELQLFTDAFRAATDGASCGAYREGMRRARVSQLANQRLYFDFTQRVPRMTLNGVEVVRGRAVVRVPFCDNDLLDFVLTVPPGFLFERYLPKVVMTTYFPRLARVPTTDRGRPMVACARDLLIQARGLLAWHARRAGLTWIRDPVRMRPYKDYNAWFRGILRPWVEEILLDPQALGRGYFNPVYIRQLLAEQAAGSNHAVRLGALLTIEIWHRQFMDAVYHDSAR